MRSERNTTLDYESFVFKEWVMFVDLKASNLDSSKRKRQRYPRRMG